MISFSEALGFASMFFWLGAQLPQIFENMRIQSCDGLALPFLANWFLGDFSNLVGCILTHQLPFQTYLATYFVSVDVVLCFQYFYYFGNVIQPRAAIPVERGASRYRTLSAVAANVAAAAALAAQQDEHIDQRRRRQRSSIDHLRRSVDRVGLGDTDEDDIDETGLAALADSFHSERGLDSRQNRVTWSIERYRNRSGSLGPLSGLPLPLVPPESPFDTAGRGRSRQRGADEDIVSDPQVVSPNRRSSRASRRGATMVFLSTWALFGIGTLVGKVRDASVSKHTYSGRVWEARELSVFEPFLTASPTETSFIAPVADLTFIRDMEINETIPPPPDSPEEPFRERVIGRIFAWLCATLYLTSRLPQIWKNFSRKSVEGLSMFLFVSAFLGNAFYVASILSSPKMQLPPQQFTEFIRESIPYLIGSGGTLLFDITIVAQSFIYRPRPRRHSILHGGMEEEETGLLSGHGNHHPSDSSALPRGRTPRTRTTTPA